MAKSKISTLKKQQMILVVSIVAALIVLFFGFAVFTNNYSAAYPNTFINGTDISGKTHEQIISIINESNARDYDAVAFNVTVGEVSKTLLASDFNIEIDAAAGADKALERNNTLNFFAKPFNFIGALFSKTEIALPIKLDEELLGHVTDEFAAGNILPVDAGYVINDDKMTLTLPIDGMMLNEQIFANTIRNKFATFDTQDISFDLELAKAKALDLDAIYAEVCKEAADAKLETVDGKSIVTPHVVGIDFDLDAAKAEHKAHPDEEIVIPLTLTQPKITTFMIQSTLFEDTLSEKTTYYSPAKVTRCANVRLAAQLVNGTILNPGEVFSFNDVVGPRTSARGFKEAAVFSRGEVVDGLGGGICQVSSTIYMAAMYADMKTVERKNHSFYVDYAPKGQDATVVYGSIDFRFENSSDYPIKILAYAKNNFITVTIKGTKTETKTVKITSNTHSTTPYTTKTIVDTSLAAGQKVVKQAGQPGMTMSVYRYVYDGNGNLLSKALENNTRYVPMTEIVHVGPEAPAVNPNPPVSEELPGNIPVITPDTPPEEIPSDPPQEETPSEPDAPTEDEPVVEDPVVEDANPDENAPVEEIKPEGESTDDTSIEE